MSNTAKVVIIAVVGLLGLTMGFLLCFFLLNRPGKEEEKDWEDVFDVQVEPDKERGIEYNQYTIRNVSDSVVKNVEVKFHFECYEDPVGKHKSMTMRQQIDQKLMSGESVTITVDRDKMRKTISNRGKYVKFEWDDIYIKEITWE